MKRTAGETVAVTPQQKYHREYLRTYKRKTPPVPKNWSPEKGRAAANRTYWRRKIEAFVFLGGACEHCGNNDMRVLDLDHVHGNGERERKALKTTLHKVLVRVYSHPQDYQLLCANCHRIKHFTDKERSAS